ncbi:hypothetical protein [Algoriphagus sp.]|uniref:PKD domain-containing protein n=1 Tax=Algoriphagus sp. TaxID=1872435 RepID=UPI00263584E1|nr:hypothetical protein [Algoriphagus sp.]
METVELRNSAGEPFDVNDDYELGDEVTGQIWVTLNGNSNNASTVYITYDIFVNNTLSSENEESCLFEGQYVTLLQPEFVISFTWNWGDVIELRDIFMYWNTGNSDPTGTVCVPPDKNVNAQCYFNEPGITAVIPLVPNFTYEPFQCNTRIRFINETIGGEEPFDYDYLWDFGPFGTSIEENPVVDFDEPGTYSVSLQSSDGTVTRTVVKEIVVGENFEIIVDITPTRMDENTGAIAVTVTGGTEPYSFEWIGPDGFYSTDQDIFNLYTGWYELTVVDANGCIQIVEYFLDVAAILSLDLSFLEAYWDKNSDQISISWETNKEADPGEFEIQRKTQAQEKFQVIGTIEVPNQKIEKTSYHFQDSAFAFNQDQLYYRIRKKTKDADYYSSVLLVRREVPKALVSDWTLFPNPSVPGENLELAFLGNEDILGQKIELRLVGPSGELGRKSIPMPANSKITFNSYFGPIPSGFYVLEVIWDNRINRIKILRN